MSKPSYTPAPLDFTCVGANASGGFHIYMIDATGRKIAALWGKSEEKEANAVLWRAAPDMLVALRKLVAVHRQQDTVGVMSADKAIAYGAAEAAIAKATAFTPDDPDAIDNCSHCGCKPEDVDRCCTTGAGSNGKPCDGEA